MTRYMRGHPFYRMTLIFTNSFSSTYIHAPQNALITIMLRLYQLMETQVFTIANADSRSMTSRVHTQHARHGAAMPPSDALFFMPQLSVIRICRQRRISLNGAACHVYIFSICHFMQPAQVLHGDFRDVPALLRETRGYYYYLIAASVDSYSTRVSISTQRGCRATSTNFLSGIECISPIPLIYFLGLPSE